MPNGEMPEELEDRIIECTRESVAGDYNPVSIKPTDDEAYALGDYEQVYQVHLITDSGREFATVEAHRDGDGWTTKFVRSTIGN